MAYITLNKQKLQHNYKELDKLFKEHNIEWAAVVKLLCGNELFLKQVLDLGIKEVCDSRISNLKTVKALSTNRLYKTPSKRKCTRGFGVCRRYF